MTLRRRLLLALAGSGFAILLGTVVAREIAIRYASEAAITSSIESRLATLDQASCEAGMDLEFSDFRQRRRGNIENRGLRPRGPDPRSWESPNPDDLQRPRLDRRLPGNRAGLRGPFGGPGGQRRTRVFFYNPDFTSREPGGPPFPLEARAKLTAGETFVNGSDQGGYFGALATSWPSGPCAYALALMPTPPPLASFTALIIGALLLVGAPALALLIALAQPVARIRALATGVREAAAGRYETSVPVTGHDEIAELGHAFNDASAMVRTHVAEVERREKALREFVAHTTHDVALPLSVLLGHVSRLRQGGPNNGDEKTVSAIAQETQYIASLLANLEAVARLESDEALHERHPVDLVDLVERVAVRHRGVAKSAGVDLNHSIPQDQVWVRGDVTLIEQAINNLVHNAIQYNHAGGHVALVLEVEDGGFALRVSDDGPGVPAADLARLGESRFRSKAARSRRPGGTGLGLSIARDVARRHGFTLNLSNRPEGGFEAVLVGTVSAVDASWKNSRS